MLMYIILHSDFDIKVFYFTFWWEIDHFLLFL